MHKFKAHLNILVAKVKFHKMQVRRANQLQRFLKKKLDKNKAVFRFGMLKNIDMNKLLQQDNDMNLTALGIKIFCKKAKFAIRKKAVVMLTQFFQNSLPPQRILTKGLAFVLGVKNIQRRFRRFKSKHRELNFELREKWDRQQFSVANWINEYKISNKKHYDSLNIEELFSHTTFSKEL